MFEMKNGESIRTNGAGAAARPDGFGDKLSVEGRDIGVELIGAVVVSFDDTGCVV